MAAPITPRASSRYMSDRREWWVGQVISIVDSFQQFVGLFDRERLGFRQVWLTEFAERFLYPLVQHRP